MTIPTKQVRSPLWLRRRRDVHREKHPDTLLPPEEDLERFWALNRAVRHFRPCYVRIGWLDTPGKPCADCGHTDFAHSGVHNPGMTQVCVLCALLITWLEMNS